MAATGVSGKTITRPVDKEMPARIAQEHRIFHVQEMLEAILLHLPTRDLLLDQAVCKNWKDAICHSIKLQQALFLEPVCDHRLEYVKGNVERCQTEHRHRRLTRTDQWRFEDDRSAAAPPKLNPLFSDFLVEMELGGAAGPPDNKRIVRNLKFNGGRASHARMHVTQPPTTCFSTTLMRMQPSDGGFEVSSQDVLPVRITIPNGITILDIVQHLEAMSNSIAIQYAGRLDAYIVDFQALCYSPRYNESDTESSSGESEGENGSEPDGEESGGGDIEESAD